MDLDDTIDKRISTKSFSKKKVSWKDALEAIDSALKAPFAGNMNNLKFIVVEDYDKILKIAELSDQSWISESSLLIVICSDDSNLENIFGERGRIYSRQHAGAAIEHILLKLTDLSISSCWVGSYTDPLVKELLKIPEKIQIEAIIPTGYSDPDKSVRKNKLELENVLRWESWGQTNRKPSYPNEEPNFKHR